MFRAFRRSVLAAVALATVSVPLHAAPADTVRTRIAGFRELGAAFKNINDSLRGSDPQIIMIQQSAREIRNTAREQYHWFPIGSGPQPGIKTRAKAEVWSQATQFKSAQDAFARQADTLQRAAMTGNADAIRAETRKLGGTCKSCHDTFRVEQD